MADQKRKITYNLLTGVEKIPDGFAKAFHAQIEKDFNHIFHSDKLQNLQAEVEARLLTETERGQLEYLLYRLDLNETTAKKCLAQKDPLQKLAMEVLKREALKVLFRLQMAGQ